MVTFFIEAFMNKICKQKGVVLGKFQRLVRISLTVRKKCPCYMTDITKISLFFYKKKKKLYYKINVKIFLNFYFSS